MSYSDLPTEEIKRMIASDERAFNLIWESEHGVILIWKTVSGALSGKIDTTNGLIARIRTLRGILKDRNVYMDVDLDEVYRKCKNSNPRHRFAKQIITKNYDGKVGAWAICMICLDEALVIEKYANLPVIPPGIPFSLGDKK